MTSVFTSLKKLEVPNNYRPKNTADSFLEDVKYHQLRSHSLSNLYDIQMFKGNGHLYYECYDKIIPSVIKKDGHYGLLEDVSNLLIINKYILHCNDFEEDEKYLLRSVHVFDAYHPQVDYRDSHYCMNHDYYEVPLTYRVWEGIREDLHAWNLDNCYYTPGKQYYTIRS